MSNKLISPQHLAIINCLLDAEAFMTIDRIAAAAKVPARTVRAKVQSLVKQKHLDALPTYPMSYRLREDAKTLAYLKTMQEMETALVSSQVAV